MFTFIKHNLDFASSFFSLSSSYSYFLTPKNYILVNCITPFSCRQNCLKTEESLKILEQRNSFTQEIVAEVQHFEKFTDSGYQV